MWKFKNALFLRNARFNEIMIQNKGFMFFFYYYLFKRIFTNCILWICKTVLFIIQYPIPFSYNFYHVMNNIIMSVLKIQQYTMILLYPTLNVAYVVNVLDLLILRRGIYVKEKMQNKNWIISFKYCLIKSISLIVFCFFFTKKKFKG